MHNVKTPTFAYVGELDIECPAPQTQEFWHAMKAMNVPTSIMIYPGEGMDCGIRSILPMRSNVRSPGSTNT